MSNSRVIKGIKNAQVALLFYFINLLLGFISRKFFIDYLGAEILGLNTTATNLLGFLNLAELGIGAAISYSLYRPLHKDDKISINEIVSVQGWLYRRIAYFVILASVALMLFFPWIFENISFPLWYVYGSFIVLLLGSLLGYFFNYRQIVLVADQKEYKLTLTVQGVKVIKVILQIISIMYFENGYVFWLIWELIAAILTSIVLNYVLKKEYSWLQLVLSSGRQLAEKHNQIIRKTKQLFFHKIADFALTQSSPLIIYAYASLTVVACYGNYMLIVSGIILLISAMQNSISAGVGSLVAEGNKEHIKAVFKEIHAFRIWIASMACFCMYYLTVPFISIWVGEEFVLDSFSFNILLVYTFISLTRTFDLFIWAYGLFQDIWAPIIEAIINIGSSILLGYYWGLPGILLGLTSSLFIIVYLWKPYFLYKYGFKENFKDYIYISMKYLILIFFSIVIAYILLSSIIIFSNIYNLVDWFIKAIQVAMIYFLISLLIFILFDKSFRMCMLRFYELMKK